MKVALRDRRLALAAILLLVGFAIGRISNDRTENASPHSAGEPVRSGLISASARKPDASNAGMPTPRASDASAFDTGSPNRISEILRNPRREDRLRGLLRLIDLENVDVLHRAIEVYELEASNGLTRLEEGRMLYNALGRLSREDALRSFGSLTDAGKTSFASRCILEGWSTIESRSALKWLLGTESNDAVLRNLGGCVLDGAFQESLQAGDDVFNGLPAHAQAHLAPTLVANRLNGSDIESTLNWIEEKFFNTSRSPDPAYEVVGDAVTRAAVSRVAELDLSEAQEFVERSTRSGMLIPGIEQDVVSRLSDQGMEVSADWLATLDPGPNVAFSPGLRDHIERWASADARAAGEWLLANTDVKGYDQLVWQFADAIEDSDPDASEMLRETVDDPEEMRIIFDPDGKRFRPD